MNQIGFSKISSLKVKMYILSKNKSSLLKVYYNITLQRTNYSEAMAKIWNPSFHREKRLIIKTGKKRELDIPRFPEQLFYIILVND